MLALRWGDMRQRVVIRGAGDMGTAVGRRLFLCGFAVVHAETAQPTVIRRAVAFASAVYEGSVTVEGVSAVLARDADSTLGLVRDGVVAVLVDPDLKCLDALAPLVVVDATLHKGKQTLTVPTVTKMAECVVALGPGFTAGRDVHAVIETQRGHDLGRVITEGQSAPYTGVPGNIGGACAERVIRAPGTGVLSPVLAIGDCVAAGDLVAHIGTVEVRALIAGVLRGLLHEGLAVVIGQKIGDVDPRGDARLCFTVSDKANAVAGGVVEAVFRGLRGTLAMESNSRNGGRT